MIVYDLGDDWLDRYRERVRAVTIDDVQRAAHAHLNPDALQVVVVGDAAAVRDKLDALGIGAVKLVE